MEEALELARAKDAKERMAGVERLHEVLEASRRSLSSGEVTSLVDCCLDLLKDSSFKVSQGALQALDSAAVHAGDHFVSSPTIIVERAGFFAWTSKSWRVREKFARTVTSVIGLFSSTELPLQRAILSPILQLLNDLNPAVREAAILCIEEMYTQAGSQFRDELQRHNLPSSLVKAINARLEGIQPKVCSSNGISSGYNAREIKLVAVNPKKSSPKHKSSSKETFLFGG
ncbi:CLIP-associating protein 1-A [Glycine soja]|uniref:CLIP-associating protein 1-A n=1 Tax=Glycine soja TaxID=3848 RepID=A0A0B2R9S0_GLYSO|nr:CLIP-associating protein 1-A [Glycine soja]